jgi:hypothetical protein
LEEFIVAIITSERISELGTTLTVTSSLNISIVMMEAILSSETSVLHTTSQCRRRHSSAFRPVGANLRASSRLEQKTVGLLALLLSYCHHCPFISSHLYENVKDM